MRGTASTLIHYLIATGSVVAATLVTLALRRWMGPSVSLFFFPAIVITAMYGGYAAALWATVLSTVTLAYFFVPPFYSFNVGPDDLLRLSAFALVGMATAWLSATRKRAEDAQRKSVEGLQAALDTVRKVIGWPVFVDSTLGGAARKLLEHTATLVGATAAMVIWETDEEPWIYVASSAAEPDAVARYPPGDLAALVPQAFKGAPSAVFEVEHLKGRVAFSGIAAVTEELMPLVEVVTREVGNSLQQLYLHDRLRQIAVREDRIRVARDLHDGVLQSLTGIRLQLQAVADEQSAPSTISDRLLAVERAIAIEQRQLRLFIADLKPAVRPDAREGSLAHSLDALGARLGAEWKIPIVVRVRPVELSLPGPAEHALRLMAHEAIVNALKHADPSRISVEVMADNGSDVRLVVSDDGRGFGFRGRFDERMLAAEGAGPVSLRERVHTLGGTMTIDSSPTGSRLEISVPNPIGDSRSP